MLSHEKCSDQWANDLMMFSKGDFSGQFSFLSVASVLSDYFLI